MKHGALIGYGLAGAGFHAPLIDSTPGLVVDVIVTANADRASRASAEFPGASVVDSVEAVWDRSDALDFVVVASANDSHAPLASRAIEAGLSVVVDKPLAVSAPEARRLVAEAEAAGVPLVPFHNRRWDSDLLTLRRLIEAGELGEVLRLESRIERWRPEPPKGAWRYETSPQQGGGVLLDLGTHLVDQALVLFGPVSEVRGKVRHVRGQAGDDDAFVELLHSSGVVSQLWASAVAPVAGPRMKAIGTSAAFVIEQPDAQEDALRAGLRPDGDWGRTKPETWGRLVRGGEDEAVEPEPGAWPLFYRRLEEMLNDGGAPPVDPQDAVAVQEILDAIPRGD